MKTFFKEAEFIFKLFIIWRLLLFIPLACSHFFLSYRGGYEFTNIWSKVSPYPIVSNFLLWPWANFDGVHYLSIAGNGYTYDARFFPLYPLLINITSKVFGDTSAFGSIQFFAGFLISNLFLLASMLLFYKLLLLDFSKKIAKGGIFFLIIFPTSFFFISLYSESLFLFLLLASFYFARQKKWILAGLAAALLSATRIVGIFILPALIYEFFLSEKLIKIKFWNWFSLSNLIKSWPIYLALIGIISYSWFNFVKWGNPIYFVLAQGDLGNSRSVSNFVFPPQTIFRYIKLFIFFPVSNYGWWLALFELSIFFLVSSLLIFAYLKKARISYLIFSLLAFLLPVSSGTFSALPRYAIVLFPIYVSFAFLGSKKIILLAGFLCIALQFVLLMLFSRGYFVA